MKQLKDVDMKFYTLQSKIFSKSATINDFHSFIEFLANKKLEDSIGCNFVFEDNGRWNVYYKIDKLETFGNYKNSISITRTDDYDDDYEYVSFIQRNDTFEFSAY